MNEEEVKTAVGDDIAGLIKDQAREVGIEINRSMTALSLYASERAAHLATVINEPGFDEALRAERDALALHAAVEGVSAADGMDDRILAVINGALTIGARAISMAVVA